MEQVMKLSRRFQCSSLRWILGSDFSLWMKVTRFSLNRWLIVQWTSGEGEYNFANAGEYVCNSNCRVNTDMVQCSFDCELRGGEGKCSFLKWASEYFECNWIGCEVKKRARVNAALTVQWGKWVEWTQHWLWSGQKNRVKVSNFDRTVAKWAWWL